MMSERDDRTYYLHRARTERAIANCAEDNSVALAHLKLADEYERRAAILAKIPQMSVAGFDRL
jgi:hypothetical protein